MERSGSVVFNDPVHGYINLDPVLVSIIHTPQFQRLKDIKQLGVTYWVYPGASHNRFEHSLGTAYLAGKMIETLRDIHKGKGKGEGEDKDKDVIEITPEEVLCVKIAGLCHDLGHGPFSHVFDTQVSKKLFQLHPNDPKLETWEHEDASCLMFDHMLSENSMLNYLEESGIGENELKLVKEMIKGKKPGKDKVHQMAKIDGIDYPKWFLFEIVANKRNGIDCDKFDYFARDCLNLGVKSNFDHTRYIQNIRIMNVDNQLQICARDKIVFNIYELFHTRWSLHHRVYQHKTTKVIEDMISDVFALTDHKFEFSKAIFDMEKYSTLTDSVLYEILRCDDSDDKCKEAKAIIKRIQCRGLYKFCGQTQPPKEPKTGALDIAKEIGSFASPEENIKPDDIFVSVVEIHFGMKESNPIDSITFFKKDLTDAIQLRQDDVSKMLPRQFSEQYVRVYAKNPEKYNIVTVCFQNWCSKRGCPIPNKLINDNTCYFTPVKSEENKEEARQKRSHDSDGENPRAKKGTKKGLFSKEESQMW